MITSVRRLMAHIIASLGEYEGELRSERQKERNNIARAHGLPTNAHAPWGWKIIGKKEHRRYVEAPFDRNVAKVILHLINQGCQAHEMNGNIVFRCHDPEGREPRRFAIPLRTSNLC